MAVFGYVRVSTKTQVEDGLSIDAQERQLRGYAMMNGLEIDELYIEKAVSGWKPLNTRPQGKLLNTVLSAGDTIICAKLDRMFRSARDALTVADELRARDVNLHLLDLGGDVTGNGVSKVFFTIVAAFAEFERDRIAERISDVKSSEKEKGRYLGGSRPYGYDVMDDGQLVENDAEQKAIATIHILRRQGKSLRAISHEFSCSGKKISHATIGKILSQTDQI